MSTNIQIAGFPLVANSSFTGRTYGKIVVEQVLRAGKSAGSNDYAVILHDRFNPTHRAVVSYTRFLTAVRSADPSSTLLALYSEARNSGLLVAAREQREASDARLQTQTAGYLRVGESSLKINADAVRATPAETVSEPNVGNVACCAPPVKKDKDWAFDRMTELLKVALYDKEVADVIKRLTHVL
ncbi:hypothetical protein AAY80_117 [Stenotrophomonas phage vB_SmaS-DLP_6]|nr:hypothetical protein AAY80_117 [Stenotrophomonas phage vB_SmaS-DLP_6]